MPDHDGFSIVADASDDGRRLDVVVASRLSGCSRSLATHLIVRQEIFVDGRIRKPGYRVKSGDTIQGRIPPAEPVEYTPEPIALDILYQDRHILVINKQAGLVVHPAPGHYSGTLVNALLYHCSDLEAIGGEIRPGIVHRLDKDTSGTMVVAKNAAAHENLAAQFKARKVQKTYLALVYGDVQPDAATIRMPIGRHPVDRKRMSTATRKGRQAETSWRVRERFQAISLLEVTLKTGRTHQIRVHCASMGHPVVGDRVYRSRMLPIAKDKKFSKLPSPITEALESVSRQMLHAWRLGFFHPHTGNPLTFESPLPVDMKAVIEKLRRIG